MFLPGCDAILDFSCWPHFRYLCVSNLCLLYLWGHASASMSQQSRPTISMLPTHTWRGRHMGYSFMLRSRNQTTNQIPRSYKNDAFDWPFDLVIVTWKNNRHMREDSRWRRQPGKNIRNSITNYRFLGFFDGLTPSNPLPLDFFENRPLLWRFWM